jgi:hypothetical protein
MNHTLLVVANLVIALRRLAPPKKNNYALEYLKRA